jgi:hypothetical protein
VVGVSTQSPIVGPCLASSFANAIPDRRNCARHYNPPSQSAVACGNWAFRLTGFALTLRECWSHDGQYIYFDTTFTENANFFQLRVSDRKLERLVSLKGMRRYWGDLGSWTALAPEDSPLLIRDTSSQEIYALDWQAP